jgi:hypothetical protein
MIADLSFMVKGLVGKYNKKQPWYYR